jgi:hypothetical protein
VYCTLLVTVYSYVTLFASIWPVVTRFVSATASLQLDVLKRKVDTYALAATFICLVQVTTHTVMD